MNDIALSYLFDENRSQASIMVRAADGQVLSAYISGEDVPALYEVLTQLESRARTAEQRLDDLRAITQGEDGLNARAFKIMQLKMQIGRLESDNDDLRARVAELEAQLDGGTVDRE